MQACRRRHVAIIRAAIRRAIETGDELARLMEVYFELATGAGAGYLAWTGLLPPRLLEALEQVHPKMNESERGRFVKFGTLFANTARELYAIRQGLLAGLPPQAVAPAAKRTRDGALIPQITRYLPVLVVPKITPEGIRRVPFIDFDLPFSVHDVGRPRRRLPLQCQWYQRRDDGPITCLYIGTKRGALLEDLNPTRRWSILDEAAIASSAPIRCGRRSHVRDDGVQWAPGMVGAYLSRCRQCYMICKLCEENTTDVVPLPVGELRDGVG